MKKNKMYRFPLDAYEKWYLKQQDIKRTLKKLTNKEPGKRQVSMARVLRFFGAKPIHIYDDEILRFFTKKKRKGGNNSHLI